MFARHAKRGPSTEVRAVSCVIVLVLGVTVLPRAGRGQCCNCDVTGDGAATAVDLASVVGCVGFPAVPPCDEEDLNCDGLVDMLDVDAVMAVITGIPPVVIPMPAPAPEPAPLEKDRFLSFVVPPAAAANAPFAIRVELAALPPAYAAFVGEYRYVNTFLTPGGVPIFTCPDDGPPFFTSYACATLGCDPQYLDWATILGGATLHVTGSAVVPDAVYDVAFQPASCMGFADDCNCTSLALPVTTALWGDVTGPGPGGPPPDGLINVIDIPPFVNKLLGVPPVLPEYRLWLKMVEPTPDVLPINVLDLSDIVSAVIGLPYPPRPITACPASICCSPPGICP